MNRKLLFIGCAALALAAVSSAMALSNAFIRPTLSYVMPTDGEYDGELSYGAAIGAYMGKKQTHEISFEVSYTAWEFSYSFRDFYVNYNSQAKETYIPFLLNYRFYLRPVSAGKLAFYMGPTIGLTKADYEASYAYTVNPPYYGSYAESGSDSDILFTFGAGAGLSYNLNERVALQIGYRYLQTTDADVDVFGYGDFQVDGLKTHAIVTAVNVRF